MRLGSSRDAFTRVSFGARSASRQGNGVRPATTTHNAGHRNAYKPLATSSTAASAKPP